ncbi:MAG TPA: hypothetical protein VNK49_00840 [Anaerolineales bacterium]|nr:hypothetical protein [Anaerolineales bacterium]
MRFSRGLHWKSREYYAAVQKAILAAPHVIQTRISFDEISEEECYIKGVITLNRVIFSTERLRPYLARYNNQRLKCN